MGSIKTYGLVRVNIVQADWLAKSVIPVWKHYGFKQEFSSPSLNSTPNANNLPTYATSLISSYTDILFLMYTTARVQKRGFLRSSSNRIQD